jgi:hypothetical protein
MKWKVILLIPLALLLSNCRADTRRSDDAVAANDVLQPQQSLSPLPVRPLSPQLERLRLAAEQDASRIRELSFTGEVGMTELSGWEYGTRASEMTRSLGGRELTLLGRLATAGGILPEGTDVGSLAASFAAMSASASYNPLDKRVLLVSQFKDKSLLVHEFTHALQDQHFDLMKLLSRRPYDFDRSEALFALIEGDAMNVQRRFEQGKTFESMPIDAVAKQEDGRFQEYRKTMGEFFQPLLTETFEFRYRDGARFVEAVRRQRGERGVDELFTNPPVSSEQIIHLDKYYSSELPREVTFDTTPFQRNGWQETVSTALGEIGIRGVLMAGVTQKIASAAAAGWGGDRAVLFQKDGSAPLFVWRIVWDKVSDALEFQAAYKELKAREGENVTAISELKDAAEIRWQKDGHSTILKRSGDLIEIVRGTDADAAWVAESKR